MWSHRFLCLLVSTIIICGMAEASPPSSEKGESPFEYIPEIESDMDVVGPEMQIQMNALKAEVGFTTDLGEGKPYPGLTAQELEKMNAQSNGVTPENRTVEPTVITPRLKTFAPADAPSSDPNLYPVPTNPEALNPED